MLGVGLAYGVWTVARLAILRVTCQTEKVKTVAFSGLEFTVEDTCCDVIAKDEVIRVYAEKKRAEGTPFISRLRHQRTLLLSYDPGGPDNPLPTITPRSESVILISVPKVADVIYLNRRWAGMSVDYDIGRASYPARPK
jgi:hypothetical protein